MENYYYIAEKYEPNKNNPKVKGEFTFDNQVNEINTILLVSK